jgi:cytoskeletal protein CcmA (bactofilin family)
MSETPQRRFMDRNANSPTLIGQGSRFEGDFTCGGDVAVAGEVEGDGRIGGLLTITDSGQWRGEVQCQQAVMAGRLQGTLSVSGKLEIRATARIHGNVSARNIAIAAGAIVEGEMIVLSGEAVQRFEEKRGESA